MANSNWAGASFDIVKQVFGCLPGWSRGCSHGASQLPPYLLVCKLWVAPACSAVKHLAIKGTDAQLQAALIQHSALCSLDLCSACLKLSAECLASLIHFPHIRSLAVRAPDISSLESVHTLTHLEQLRIDYGDFTDEEEVPHLPCTDFSRLTSLDVGTGWQEPQDTFLHLTQLQTLRHLSLSTVPSDFNYAALSLLTRLHIDNFVIENLEVLQELPQLMNLTLRSPASDADILLLANLTTLIALHIMPIVYGHGVNMTCHLSSVLMLSSLVNLESLRCEVEDGSACYTVDTVPDPANACMIVSIPDAPFAFPLFHWGEV